MGAPRSAGTWCIAIPLAVMAGLVALVPQTIILHLLSLNTPNGMFVKGAFALAAPLLRRCTVSFDVEGKTMGRQWRIFIVVVGILTSFASPLWAATDCASDWECLLRNAQRCDETSYTDSVSFVMLAPQTFTRSIRILPGPSTGTCFVVVKAKDHVMEIPDGPKQKVDDSGSIFLLSDLQALAALLKDIKPGLPGGEMKCQGGMEYSTCTLSYDWGEAFHLSWFTTQTNKKDEELRTILVAWRADVLRERAAAAGGGKPSGAELSAKMGECAQRRHFDMIKCYVDLAFTSGNVAVCDQIKSFPSDKRNCATSVKAMISRTPKLCEELNVYKADCYLTVADGLDDKAICDLLDESDKPQCLSRYAVRHKDVQVCVEISNAKKKGSSLGERDCYTGVALRTKDIKVCDLFAGAKGMDPHSAHCYTSLAIEFGDKGICETFFKDNVKQECLMRVDAAKQYPNPDFSAWSRDFNSAAEFYANAKWDIVAIGTKDPKFCEYARKVENCRERVAVNNK